MANRKQNANPFEIKDCALIAIATGKRAQNLKELRNYLMEVGLDCIYYHFWGGLLRPRFDDPEYHNDFAIWVHRALHDKVLAERLSLIDPSAFAGSGKSKEDALEDLRYELIEIIEDHLDEQEYVVWARGDNQFEFIRSQIVIFDTHHTINKPEDFIKVIPDMSLGSIFFHFIDARRRNPDAVDDFRNWLYGFGNKYLNICQKISEVDPYFSSLSGLRNELNGLFKFYFDRGANG